MWRVWLWKGEVWYVKAVKVGLVDATCSGWDWLGELRRLWRGMARYGETWQGWVWRGGYGGARLGWARLGWVRRGKDLIITRRKTCLIKVIDKG